MDKFITLYKDNKIDQEYKLSYKEITDSFVKSNYFLEDYLQQEIYIIYCLQSYLAYKDGLNSSYDLIDFDELYEYIKKEIK